MRTPFPVRCLAFQGFATGIVRIFVALHLPKEELQAVCAAFVRTSFSSQQAVIHKKVAWICNDTLLLKLQCKPQPVFLDCRIFSIVQF